jgi:hypothetical protein
MVDAVLPFYKEKGPIDFKLSADQEDADGQCCYGLRLQDGKGTPMDLPKSRIISILSPIKEMRWSMLLLRVFVGWPRDLDGSTGNGQWPYGKCFRDQRGIPINLQRAVHDFKLSLDQESAFGQFQRAMHFLTTDGIERDQQSECPRRGNGWIPRRRSGSSSPPHDTATLRTVIAGATKLGEECRSISHSRWSVSRKPLIPAIPQVQTGSVVALKWR